MGWSTLLGTGLPDAGDIDAACRQRGLPADAHALALALREQVKNSLGLLSSIVGDRPVLSHVPLTDHRSRTIADLQHRATIAEARADALDEDLALARAEVARLEAAVAEAADDREEAEVYAVLGLRAHAHEVVIKAARRSLLSFYHPDRWPVGEQDWAKRRFQGVQAAADMIDTLGRARRHGW